MVKLMDYNSKRLFHLLAGDTREFNLCLIHGKSRYNNSLYPISLLKGLNMLKFIKSLENHKVLIVFIK